MLVLLIVRKQVKCTKTWRPLVARKSVHCFKSIEERGTHMRDATGLPFLMYTESSTAWSKSHATHSWHALFAFAHFRRIIHSEEKVFSVTLVESVTKFDGYRQNYCHLTPKVNRNGFCPARFLCHGNGSPDEILSICLAQENREYISELSYFSCKSYISLHGMNILDGK
jgi:hypothetical protein